MTLNEAIVALITAIAFFITQAAIYIKLSNNAKIIEAHREETKTGLEKIVKNGNN